MGPAGDIGIAFGDQPQLPESFGSQEFREVVLGEFHAQTDRLEVRQAGDALLELRDMVVQRVGTAGRPADEIDAAEGLPIVAVECPFRRQSVLAA